MQLHVQIFKNGYTYDVFLLNTLVNIYARIGDMVYAREVFDEMPFRNSISWSCLISGYTRNRMPNETCTSFREMIREGFQPVHYAVGSVLRACQVLESHGLRFGIQVHGLVSKSLNAFHEVVCNGLLSMYGNCMDSADYASCVFDEMEIRSLVSWNSIISVYSHKGDAVSAFKLLSGMQAEGLRPTEYTFGSLITAASSLSEINSFLLDQAMCTIEKSGFLYDLYVGSALVSGFARSGKITIARKIFELMDVRNVVSMHGLMVGLARQKHGEAAVEVFLGMKDLVKLTSDSYAILLSTLSEFSILEEGRRKGREVHAYVIRNGLSDSNVAIGNGLINMYAKCGTVTDAASAFKLLMNKDDVSWNSIITGFDQNAYFRDAVMMFCAMRRNQLMPANFTLISALSSCASLGWLRLGEQIHCEGVKLGLDTDVSVSNSLIDFYSETECINNCKKVFLLMHEYDQVSWNSIIGALSDSDPLVPEAVEYLMEMMRGGWRPNLITFVNILGAVSSLSVYELVRQIHGLTVKYHFAGDNAVENAILSCYGKCGYMDDCEKLFSRIVRKDETSWNSMISGYIHNELLKKAMDLVSLMLTNGQRLDCFTFATVLSACASVATLERGMEVHACGIRAYVDSDVVVGSALVDMYSKCGRIDYASRLFTSMPVKNVYSWNSMISGYARHGHGDKSLETFTKMKLQGQLPDHVTFVGVLSACSHIGLVDQGFDHFNSMSKVYGLKPKMEHFSCMVDILGRAGELDKMEEFLNKMPMNPSVLIWRTVLGACCRANGQQPTNLGKRAGEKLLELEPNNAVNYVLLSNMYAFRGKWEDMKKTRLSMKLAAVKKEAGCSWVTMKDGVHVFVASDKSHPDTEAIYEKLKELQGKMREMGYVPEIRYALRDLELENQEEILSYHSEKLAVAFVLTRKSELPIRIMKNLRICGDCHTVFKYVSKIEGRVIVVRDSNRFHHFVDGNCSCGDYW
ncbi:putative pentatricopeptide repeat-containing protein At5g09950 [Cynara cardunculus var. scolymus]|uniref:putative pentatricopeptide repeat-containing protein At5g09950 n=1 Tax=Cynara cardunculus var. scolymus TaxID=59895 RepID=UPI000D63003E|nr:putative pentatricopeptide repeat-containing protein At5g09950 [Cynara cardunculus var. scolymus]